MPTKEEIMQFVQETLDKTRYQDYLLYVKETKDKFLVLGKRVGIKDDSGKPGKQKDAESAQGVLDSC